MKALPMKAIAVLLLAVFIAGCASMAEGRLRGERADLLERGFPAPYADGYVDGCSSGSAAGGASAYKFRKNVNRFDVDSKYQQGWNDGYRNCKAEMDRLSF